MELNHFLITRFNLKKKEWQRDKNQKEILDDVWLEKRIELFNKFCFPSVLSQTTKDFEWLIFFEKKSGENVNQLIDQLSQYPFIIPFFVNGYEEFQEKLPSIISERSGGQLILTTRLDNDDALQIDFMKGIQKAIYALTDFPVILCYPNGLFLDLNLPAKLGGLQYPNNQFLSLAEPKSKYLPKTVYGEEHHRWRNFPFVVVNKNYSWLQISHEDNQENVFKGWLTSRNKLKDFDVFPVKFPFFYEFHVLLHQVVKFYINLPGRYFLKVKFKNLKSLKL